jgi:hypothetical protein
VRQRNTSGYTQHVSAWPTEQFPDHRPFDVGDGEECDFPELLAGFEPTAAPKPKKSAAAAQKEEGEPQ